MVRLDKKPNGGIGMSNWLARSSILTITVGAWLLFSACLTNSAHGQFGDYEREPINYETAETNDDAAKLAEKIASGEQVIAWDDKHGYLPGLLAAFDIPVESQTLVFSKTSLQLSRISPRHPRALYFNDDVYVGWCYEGDVIEIAVTSPTQAAVFYTVRQKHVDRPTILRDRGQCLACHASSRTQNVPGYLLRSVFPDRSGQPMYGSGTKLTNMASEYDDRWGGWYATGSHGSLRHMGNQIATGEDGRAVLDRDEGANRPTLDEFFDTSAYLSGHSDIVALMVLAHQTQMHNALAKANFETRLAVHQSQEMNKLLDRAPDYLSDSAQRRIAQAAENVVEHLLMCDEPELNSQVKGSSDYAKVFEAMGPRTADGRSLRDFDLKNRLFRYPCSYLVYSDAFAGLPDLVRQKIVSRVNEILKADDPVEGYEHLTIEDRRAILGILRETTDWW